MSLLNNPKPEKVFKYFEEISSVPRGSGNMKQISRYCVDFAKKHSLKFIKDEADNVIIYKPATIGYKNSDTIILQGHLDMVCQKENGVDKDFLNEGIDIYTKGDFIKAEGTTLGADNGIAVAMILSILESEDIPHPPIEAVLTSDEEIGMIGATKLDFSLLSGKKMINIDSEEEDTLTVSCAGGSDFKAILPVSRVSKEGTLISIKIEGLKGGHSGMEINSGRINADILAGKLLKNLKNHCDFSLLSISGGEKGNAIPDNFEISILTSEPENFSAILKENIEALKTETKEAFSYSFKQKKFGKYEVIEDSTFNDLISILNNVPNGVIKMSEKIENLVETSLNLGILKTEKEQIIFHHTLRSNDSASLKQLEQRLSDFYKGIPCYTEKFGYYPPWEYKENSPLRELYKKTYSDITKKEINIAAIHAGLECGVFASNIPNLDCIAIGPWIYDVHTPKEKLNISSTEFIYNMLLEILKEIR